MQTAGRRVPIDAIYTELRQLSARRLDPVRPAALVHEVWSRLARTDHAASERARCLSLGAIAVRQILAADGARRMTLGDAFGSGIDVPVADLDKALKRLENEDPTLARMIQLRVFGDLSVEEAADALEIPRADGRVAWDKAQDWLAREFGADGRG